MNRQLISLILLSIFILQIHCELPSNFVGEWQGSPNYSVLGPWGPYLFNFSISVVNNNNSYWLMQDSFNYDVVIADSAQEFWVQEGVGLMYCGLLKNFFPHPAPIVVNFTENYVKETQIQWCEGDCSLVSWTLTLLDENTLNSQLYLENPVYHFNVTLTRISSKKPHRLIPHWSFQSSSIEPDSAFPFCNVSGFTDLSFTSFRRFHGDDVELTAASFSRCPYAHLPSSSSFLTSLSSRSHPRDQSNDHHVIIHSSEETKQSTPSSSSSSLSAPTSYEFCYSLNPVAEFNLAWNFNENSQTVDINLSMPISSTSLSDRSPSSSIYIALGFQPDFPGMYNADVALGYLSANGEPCVRAMYVPYYVGTPKDDPSFQLTNQNVVLENGILSVSFTRAFNTGHHNITVDRNGKVKNWSIMWASGPAPSDCSSPPSYHGNLRGVRAIDWAVPSSDFSDALLCN